MGRPLSRDKPEPKSFCPELDFASATWTWAPAAAPGPSKQLAAAFPASTVVKLPTLPEPGFTPSGWGVFPKFQASPPGVSFRAASGQPVRWREGRPRGFRLRSRTTAACSPWEKVP